jgi:ribosomal-protein-alanine N-acetyltransferase
MTLRTEQLILTTWQSSEWTVLRPVARDPEVMRYITGGIPWTDEKIRSFIDRQVKLYAERGYCRWKLIEQSTGEVIGFCGPGAWRDELEPEIGWWLARHCWGRGLATEAAGAALRDAFERVGLNRLVSIAEPANVASRRIMEKLGLRFESEFESDGISLVRYAIDRAAYERHAPSA